ncbi:hypothetical protein DFH08DRAFT_809045 [Mycena albidolilacea]|uniref:Uncharacterized protein n=1 Tax=Mycena albidolilacea TaxID=1033008 RepID=A0AAD7ERC1_9AGAR|nr:hypothetical protein DFH08DRAFT_809045 [Mycena albidolilacea]
MTNFGRLLKFYQPSGHGMRFLEMTAQVKMESQEMHRSSLPPFRQHIPQLFRHPLLRGKALGAITCPDVLVRPTRNRYDAQSKKNTKATIKLENRNDTPAPRSRRRPSASTDPQNKTKKHTSNPTNTPLLLESTPISLLTTPSAARVSFARSRFPSKNWSIRSVAGREREWFRRGCIPTPPSVDGGSGGGVREGGKRGGDDNLERDHLRSALDELLFSIRERRVVRSLVTASHDFCVRQETGIGAECNMISREQVSKRCKECRSGRFSGPDTTVMRTYLKRSLRADIEESGGYQFGLLSCRTSVREQEANKYQYEDPAMAEGQKEFEARRRLEIEVVRREEKRKRQY